MKEIKVMVSTENERWYCYTCRMEVVQGRSFAMLPVRGRPNSVAPVCQKCAKFKREHIEKGVFQVEDDVFV